MPLYILMILIAGVATIALYIDAKISISSRDNIDVTRSDITDGTTLLSVTTIMAPFLILFYTEQFWSNLLYLAPLYIYIFALAYFSEIAKYYTPPLKTQDKLYSFPASIIFSIIIYYIFFDISDNQNTNSQVIQPIATTKEVMWPYYAYTGMACIYVIVTLIDWVKKNNAKYSAIFLDIFTLITPFIPLFTENYWTLLLLGNITIILVFILTLNKLTRDSGGIITAFTFVLILASIFSIAIYTIRYLFF